MRREPTVAQQAIQNETAYIVAYVLAVPRSDPTLDKRSFSLSPGEFPAMTVRLDGTKLIAQLPDLDLSSR